jgi:NADPH:quinone reductase-like Zn-dependent oxidoreductase
MKQKRVLITRKGGPEVLEVVEREVPEPGPGEARVKVLATGVAFADVMMRQEIPHILRLRLSLNRRWRKG